MELSAKVREFLAAPRFAVMATTGTNGMPQQTVMWYDLRGDTVMMNTAEGRVKMSNLRRNPRVSFCVEDGYTYVTLTGTVTLVDDPETTQADIAHLAERYYGKGTPQANESIAGFRKQKRYTLLLTVERVVTKDL